MFNFFEGMHYFIRGFKQLLTPGLRRFIIIPMLFNLILFIGLFYLGYHYVLPYTYHYIDKLPSWLSFLNHILLVLFVLGFALIFFVMFTVVFNAIAAPFNGLLAEKVQKLLYSRAIPPIAFANMTVRTLKRQGQFLKYFIPRFLTMAILFFIPFIQPIFPLMWFLFTAWMLSMQFQDLAFDNNLINFYDMQSVIRANKMRSLGLGSAINLIGFIPILNIVIMPAAVIGSTMLFCETNPEVKRANLITKVDLL